MKKGHTKIVLIVDKSGSMSSVHTASIQGINTFVKSQNDLSKELNGTADFTLVLFSDNDAVTYLFDNQDLSTVEELNLSSYYCSGWTALYSTVCSVIDKVGAELAVLDEPERPETVVVAILTDGADNDSGVITKEMMAEKIKHQTDVYKWNFQFLAANMDAKETAQMYNIKDAVQFHGNAESVATAYMAASANTRSYRTK